ncbi:MAG: MFS transporter [Stackebrandtia sp.]
MLGRVPADVIAPPRARRRIHRAWWVAAVAFIAIIGAAGFRATPGILIDPLHAEFGWSRGTIGSAVTVNLVLYGLTSPFAAALMDRFGMRRVVTGALTLVAAGSAMTLFMKSSWELVIYWGFMVGLGTGSMAMAFAGTVTTVWFVKRRGVVTGILTAAGATGQLVFLPLLAILVENHDWRAASAAVACCALAVVPLVWWLLRDKPEDVGVHAYGATGPAPPPAHTGNAAARALSVLAKAARTRTFWLLAAGFAICGASTNGLVSTHFVPAAHDHGMPTTMAASLLAVIGIFDIIGTVASGWFTDRFDPRKLLAIYYGLRGVSLLVLPSLLDDSLQPPILFFVVFYGLDWIATVPPTLALCRTHFGDGDGPIVFGWVLASHQIGAGITAAAAGLIRDGHGSYNPAWLIAGGLCGVATILSLAISGRTTATTVGEQSRPPA